MSETSRFARHYAQPNTIRGGWDVMVLFYEGDEPGEGIGPIHQTHTDTREEADLWMQGFDAGFTMGFYEGYETSTGDQVRREAATL